MHGRGQQSKVRSEVDRKLVLMVIGALAGAAVLSSVSGQPGFVGAVAGAVGIVLARLLMRAGLQPRRSIERPVVVGPFTVHHSQTDSRELGQVQVSAADAEVARVPVFDRRDTKDTATWEGRPTSMRTWTYRRQWWRQEGRGTVLVIRRTGALGVRSLAFRFDSTEIVVPYCHDCSVEELLQAGWSACEASGASMTQAGAVIGFLAAEQYRAVWPARWRTSETADALGR